MVGVLALTGVVSMTMWMSMRGLRAARSTSDFYVASRLVRPWQNASAIGGEYLAAASVLGVAGIVLGDVLSGVWLMLSFTGGFFVLLVLIVAPLRRSNAYTVSDFAQVRFGSISVRRAFTVCVCLICGAYIVPQLHAASLVVHHVVGGPRWAGPVVLALVVGVTAASGGMRSLTLAQVLQYWLKVVSLLVPLVVMVFVIASGDASRPPTTITIGPDSTSPYWRISQAVAVVLGAASLPHVLVRFCTSPDGRSAERSAGLVLGLVGLFYLIPLSYGLVGRHLGVVSKDSDALVLQLPAAVVGARVGDLLGVIVAAGVFSALLASSSGLVFTIASTVSQDLMGAGVAAFRKVAIGATLAATAFALLLPAARVTDTLAVVFAFAASTLFPPLLLGIWSKFVTAGGTLAGMAVGGLLVLAASVTSSVIGSNAGFVGDLMGQPAAWTVPLALSTSVAVSIAFPASPSQLRQTEALLAQMHSPDDESVQTLREPR